MKRRYEMRRIHDSKHIKENELQALVYLFCLHTKNKGQKLQPYSETT